MSFLKQHTNKLLSGLLAILMLTTLVAPVMANLQWGEDIQRFERYNPVYSEEVDNGTTQSELNLPETLRALVPLPENLTQEDFVQAHPTADTTDGYEMYDYYQYGYIMPRNGDELYAQDELVIYSIHYAAQDGSGAVGEICYRVYGSMGGSENLWFACNEAGTITGAILDIPVIWSGTYDALTAGTYTLKASVDSSTGYKWNGAKPTAEITVKPAVMVHTLASLGVDTDEHEAEGVADCTCAELTIAEDGTVIHEESCPAYVAPEPQNSDNDADQTPVATEPECTCGAEADEDGTVWHGIDCPAYQEPVATEPECTCGAEPDEDGTVWHGIDCPAYQEPVATEPECTCGAEPDEDGHIHHAEDCPAYEEPVTTEPECTCGAEPDEDGHIHHAEDCPAYEEPVATEPECTCGAEPDEDGHIHHAEDCPLFEEELLCTCDLADNEVSHLHAEDCPCFKALVCDCGAEDTPNPWEHADTCDFFSPIECMCKEEIEVTEEFENEDGSTYWETYINPGEYSHIHNPEDVTCPLHGISTVQFAKADGSLSYMSLENATRIVEKQEAGEMLYPILGEIQLIEGSEQIVKAASPSIGLMSANGGGGAADAYGDSQMRANISTSGNASFVSGYTGGVTIPGSWVDYVNTIWMNKAFNVFAWTTAANTAAFNSWAWSGQTANGTTGTVANNSLKIPSRSTSGVWNVYSGEQLMYALNHVQTGDTVNLKANINLNGMKYNWTAPVLIGKTITINGGGRIIYNLGLEELKSEGLTISPTDSFIGNYEGITVENLTFKTAKLVARSAFAGLFSARPNRGVKQQIVFTNVKIEDSMIATLSKPGAVSPFGMISGGSGATVINQTTVTQCATSGNYIYGSDHISGFGFAGTGTSSTSGYTYPWSSITYSYSANNLLCGYGGHSAGFQSCNGGHLEISACFANNEIYGSASVGGFMGQNICHVTDCFSTGKLEGYQVLGGFAFTEGGSLAAVFNTERTFTRCYSTVLVGLRSNPARQGGFIESVVQSFAKAQKNTMVDCYAAGEVGNHDLNTSTDTSVGGFFGNKLATAGSTYSMTNCYYDKQTTAMREWVSGAATSYPGVTGVLTSTNTKAGTGLASGTYGSAADKGFRGFSDNSKWVYTSEHYPQLEVFATGDISLWGTSHYSTVKSNSLASTGTVFLDTWDTGYDWDDTGVRSQTENSYNRTLASTLKTNHKGYEYTYDTVREIVSDAPVTSTLRWSQMISGGAPTDTNGDGVKDGTSMTVTATDGIRVKDTGMDWYRIETMWGAYAWRPIRLTAYMKVEAGADKSIATGNIYNHRADVSLTMMNQVIDDLVIGMDDTKVWSSSVTGGYPNSKKYWAVPTTHMETKTEASKDAWIYTSIWRVEQDANGNYKTDADGNYITDASVKVTGTGTGAGTTLAEQRWNGEIPLYTSTTTPNKYIVTYYWMLSDGRYRTDSKEITIVPDKFDVTVNVKNALDNTANNNSLKLGVARDNGVNTNYSYTASTVANANLNDVPFTKNTAVAWKKNNDQVKVTKAELTMTTADGTVMGKVTHEGDLKEGDTLTIPVLYYYNEYTTKADDGSELGYELESVNSERLNIVYTVMKDASGGYYLRFNKLANAPANEAASALVGGDSSGIPAGAKAYINDIQYDINLTLWVGGDAIIQLKKVVSNYETDMAGQLFPIELTEDVVVQTTLEHNETSKEIVVDATSALTVDIAEIVPMQYKLTNITITNTGAGQAPTLVVQKDTDGAIVGGTITIYAQNKVLITVTNEFNAQSYFKANTSVKNTFTKGA